MAKPPPIPTLADLPPAACRLVTSLAVDLDIGLEGIPRRLAQANIHLKVKEVRPIAAAIRAEAIRAASLDPDNPANCLPPRSWPDSTRIGILAGEERERTAKELAAKARRVYGAPSTHRTGRVYGDPVRPSFRRLGAVRGDH